MERSIEPVLRWRVEETCLNAWPALREVVLEGWLLRFSEGLTRRGNSANSLAPFGCPRLAECQRLYHRMGLPTIFRVLSFSDPAIDQQLAEAGYTPEGESCVLYGEIDGLFAAPRATSTCPAWTQDVGLERAAANVCWRQSRQHAVPKFDCDYYSFISNALNSSSYGLRWSRFNVSELMSFSWFVFAFLSKGAMIFGVTTLATTGWLS
jgi:hypothetical protein